MNCTAMKKIIFICASALAIVCSCAKNNIPAENPGQNPQQNEEITVPEGYVLYQLNSELAKVAISEKTLSWEVGDSIKLITDKGAYISKPIQSAGTSATFSFAIPAEDTPLYGVYPATLTTSIVNDSLRVNFPGEVVATYANSNMMCGKVDGNSIAFKNVAHIIKFTTENADMSRIQICELGGANAKGEISVVFKDQEVVVEPTGNTTSRSFSSKVEGAGTYYIAVYPSETPWTGIGIRTATGTPGNYKYSTGFIGKKAFTPKRNTITNLGNIDGLFATEVNVQDGTELSDILNTDGKIAKMWYLDGKTLKLGEGTYTVTGSEIKNNSVGEGISFSIIGAGKDKTIIDGGEANRFIKVLESNNKNTTNINIEGVTIQNCSVAGENGGALFLSSKKVTLTVKNSLFQKNKTDQNSSGACVFVKDGKATIENCAFTGNYARNGASVFTQGNAEVSAKGCTFTGEKTYNTGGAANVSGGTQTYENCTFDGCSTTNGTGGALHVNADNAKLTLKNCTIKNCKAFTTEAYTKNTNKAAGGAISLQNAYVDIDDCTIDGNEGSAGSAILVQGGSGLLRVNNTVFKGNTGASRGLIQLNGMGAAFFNNCSFHDNHLTTTDWGRIIHGGNPSVACFNNCTIYNNTTNGNGGNSVCLNNDGSVVVVNSTIVNSNACCLVRNTNTSKSAVLIANSILLNTYSGGKVFSYFTDSNSKLNDNMKTSCKTYNCYLGQTSDVPPTWTSTNDKKYISSIAGGQFDSTKGVYFWNGPAVEDEFTKAKEADVKGLLNAMTVNNGNTRVGGAFGPAFATWLESKGGFTKDALGATRTVGGTWPGAIETAN